MRNPRTTRGLFAIILGMVALAAHAEDRKIVRVIHDDASYQLDAKKGTSPHDAYAKFVETAKESATNNERIRTVTLTQDGTLVYTVDQKFFILVGKNQIRHKYDDAYLQRVLGTHVYLANGTRAYGTPRRITHAAEQRVHRKQFDALLANWTGVKGKSLKWDDSDDQDAAKP